MIRHMLSLYILHPHSEEEKLKVSKMLVDMQIECNELKGGVAKDKYTLETKLLTSEGDLVEVQAREKALIEKNQQLQKQMEVGI